MAIIAIIAATAIPAMTSVVVGNNLTRAGQQVADQINLAKQISSSKNTTVELRICKLSGATGYTELQLGTYSSTGTWTGVNHIIILPQNISISPNTTLSTAFNNNTTGTFATSGYGSVSGATYYPFEFRPSGIVTTVQTAAAVLNMNTFCLVILPNSSLTAANLTAVKNYAIVQINPMTATPLIYRP